MEFQEDQNSVHWKLHLNSPPEKVYEMIATDSGRMKFWPEASTEQDGSVELQFVGEANPVSCKILEKSPPHRFSFHYWGRTTVTFELRSDGQGGTDLLLNETEFPSEGHRIENMAGWVTVLMALKAAVDHGIDLRNHDPVRTWNNGYCET